MIKHDFVGDRNFLKSPNLAQSSPSQHDCEHEDTKRKSVPNIFLRLQIYTSSTYNIKGKMCCAKLY